MNLILIIDDSPTDTRVIQSLLERNGFSVITADSAETGLPMVESKRPDLVLMDVVLPGMNGFQATRALSKNPETMHVPVVILTTKQMEADRVWGMRQGAKDFFSKPAGESDLIARIRALIES